MKEGHIFIQGIISPWQDKAAEDYGEVNIKQVTQQIQNNKEADKLIVHIHSPGGDVDEGFGIHDILVASGKEIETRIEGLCASIATVIAMAGTVRAITENSEFMIHTPWTMVGGDADELKKYTDQLQAIEDKVIDFYVAKTGSSRESIEAMMKNETWLDANQAKELGFVTEIITTMKAVALFNIKNSNKNITMNQKELETAIDKRHDSLLDKLKKMLNLSGVKMLTITAGDGTILDFGDQVTSVEEIEVGMKATIEGGAPPEGDYVMPDGRTFVFAAGVLTEIKEAAGGDDAEALKAEIEQLKKDLDAEKAKNTTTQAAIVDLQKDITTFKAQMKSDIKGLDPESFSKADPNAPADRSPGKPKLRTY